MRTQTFLSVPSLDRTQSLALGTAICVVAGAVALALPDISALPYLTLSLIVVAWNSGRRWALVFVALAAVEQLALAVHVGRGFGIGRALVVEANALFVCGAALWLTSRLRAFYDRERDAARVDHLTQVMNRKGFEERLESEIARHGRNRLPFSVVCIDCDDFKSVNDRLGHGEGDRLLETIASTIMSHVRRSDIVCRLGGDEFAVLFPETTSAQALVAVSKLHDALTAIASPRWQVTFSVGIAIFQSLPSSWTAAMAFAVALMYRAKNSGKNSTVAAEFHTTIDETRGSMTFTRLARSTGFRELVEAPAA